MCRDSFLSRKDTMKTDHRGQFYLFVSAQTSSSPETTVTLSDMIIDQKLHIRLVDRHSLVLFVPDREKVKCLSLLCCSLKAKKV